MSENLNQKNELVGGYRKQIKTRTVGPVQKNVVSEVVGTIRAVFNRMGYNGEPPEVVSISQGSVKLPSGEDVTACYGYDQPGIPGRIYVSAIKSKKDFGKSKIPTKVAASAFGAHEAVEHVNNMRGKKLLSSRRKLTSKEHQSPTEREANNIAREIVEKRYGWTVRFGDENE